MFAITHDSPFSFKRRSHSKQNTKSWNCLDVGTVTRAVTERGVSLFDISYRLLVTPAGIPWLWTRPLWTLHRGQMPLRSCRVGLMEGSFNVSYGQQTRLKSMESARAKGHECTQFHLPRGSRQS